MKPLLCKAGQQLREQIDDCFPDRDRKSDGWIGDLKHASKGSKSDHNPDYSNKNSEWAYVRAIDVDANLDSRANTSVYFADQIRECAKRDKRIKYIIHKGKIASAKSLWRWRPYTGINRHDHHIHCSFSTKGDTDSSFFKIPMLGANT